MRVLNSPGCNESVWTNHAAAMTAGRFVSAHLSFDGL